MKTTFFPFDLEPNESLLVVNLETPGNHRLLAKQSIFPPNSPANLEYMAGAVIELMSQHDARARKVTCTGTMEAGQFVLAIADQTAGVTAIKAALRELDLIPHATVASIEIVIKQHPLQSIA